MALNIDTIRSLEANKTYYLANSTGEIKEAGAWQQFKCFFGIADARQKVQNLIDQVKVALLEASGESGPSPVLTQTPPAKKELETSFPCNLLPRGV